MNHIVQMSADDGVSIPVGHAEFASVTSSIGDLSRGTPIFIEFIPAEDRTKMGGNVLVNIRCIYGLVEIELPVNGIANGGTVITNEYVARATDSRLYPKSVSILVYEEGSKYTHILSIEFDADLRGVCVNATAQIRELDLSIHTSKADSWKNLKSDEELTRVYNVLEEGVDYGHLSTRPEAGIKGRIFYVAVD